MKFQEIPTNTPDDEFVFIECDITGKTKKTRYGAAKANVNKNNGLYITNWGLAKLNNPMKNDAVKAKVKNTNLEKYGTVMPMNSKENIEKRKELFKDEEFVKQRLEKSKQTNLKKFGVEHAAQNPEITEKMRHASIEKYGTNHPMQNKNVLAKTQATNLERYGNICSLNDPDVRAKALKSLSEHYGVEYYNQTPEMREYLKINCREWLKECWANPWAKGITRPEEWNKKQRETVSKRIIDGTWHGGFKSNTRGYFPAWKCKKQMPRFLSSLELIFHFFLNANPLVEWYIYQPFAIPYEKQDGTKHLYHPDYQVKYFDEETLHIFETKTYQVKDSIDVWLKHDAAVKYANENNMTYTILFDEDVHALGIALETAKEFPGILFDKDINKEAVG